MADPHTAPPLGDSVQQKPASGSIVVSRQPEPPDTAQRTAKRRVGVYDRPKSVLGSWLPMTLFVLGLGILWW
jgi:hypothetical protein